jgi:hypothetical protein
MNNKEFCPCDIAKALKDLGFDEECLMWYPHEKLLTADLIFRQYKDTKEFCDAPLRQQAFRWLRDKYQYMHDIDDIAIMTSSGNGYRFKYAIWKILGTYESLVYDDSALGYLTYEDAEIACLKHIIKLIKTKSNE